MASPTVLIFSACSSGMVISNSSSSSMTSSTMSSESAPTSSMNEVLRVTCSLLTPRFSQTISITRSSTEGTANPPRDPIGPGPRVAELFRDPARPSKATSPRIPAATGVMGRMYSPARQSESPTLVSRCDPLTGHAATFVQSTFALHALQQPGQDAAGADLVELVARRRPAGRASYPPTAPATPPAAPAGRGFPPGRCAAWRPRSTRPGCAAPASER